MAKDNVTQKEDFITPVKPTTVLGDDSIDDFEPSLLFGSNKNDIFEGTDKNDTFFGGRGHDVLHGGAGDDILDGESGNDTLYGGTGDDILYGDHGDDILHGGPGNDIMDGGHGKDILHGDEGHDKIYGASGDDTLYGNAGNDKLYGGPGIDILEGGDGDDILRGGAGRDILRGDAGHDFLLGDMHDKSLQGGAGNDLLQVDVDALKKITIQDILVDIDGGVGMDILLFNAHAHTVKSLLMSGSMSNTEMIIIGHVDRESVSDVLARLKIIDIDENDKYELHGWKAATEIINSPQGMYREFTKHVGADELTILINTLYLQNP